MTPFLVEPDRAEPIRQRVEEYAAIMRQVGQAQGVLVVELQPAFDRASAVITPQLWAPDRVHPSDAGHALITLNVLQTAGAAL